EVTFDIDANGILTVSAKDLDTGKQQSITIDDSGRMSDDEVDRAIRDAEQYAEQDEARRDAMLAREEAQRLANEADQALAQKGKQLEKDEKKQIKADVAAVRKLLSKKVDKVDEADVAVLRTASEQLERSSARARNLVQQG
ncbi:MAG: Hsp70 family protein, partial [Gordonibacter urolithinfaciens]